MTDKITLATVSELQAFPSAAAAINSNSAIITAAMDNTLSRDGTSPNTMSASLDMNSSRIVNLPEPITSQEPLRLQDLEDFVGGTLTVNSIPSGGTAGQALKKNTSSNYDVSWTSDRYPGGSTNQMLKKNSATDYDASWVTVVPPAGTTGQVLRKTSGTDYDTSWASTVKTIAGNTGDFTLTNGITNSTNAIGLTVGQLPGEPTTGLASAGNIGEVVSGTSSAVALVTTVSKNVISITLTPGDWDISCNVNFVGAGSTSVTNSSSSISTTTAVQNTTVGFYASSRVPASVDLQVSQNIGPTQVSISTPTTYFLVCQATFTVNIYTVSGTLRARRMR